MINKNNHLMLPISGQSAAKTTFSRIAGLVLVLAAVLLSSSICSASVANVYVAQNATGSANGADCADALPLTWVNTAGNWGGNTNQIGPGTTVHLCGTITGSAGGQAIAVNGSGLSGNPITIKFETNAVLTAPYWNVFGAITAGGKSWITIDGGTNGIIQNTDNGSPGSFTYQQASRPIYITGPASNIVIKNLTVANACQHTSVTDSLGCSAGGNSDTAIWVQGGLTNITITNNLIHDTVQGVAYVSSTGDSGITISNNTISRTNWGIAIAPIGIWSGLLITGNDISCVVAGPCNWNDNANGFHHNGIMIDPLGAADIASGVVISNNFIHDINTCTAGIFFDPAAGDVPNAKVYNNVFYTTPGQIGPSDGWITVGIGTTNTLVVNNTILGPGGAGINAQVSPAIENNIFANISWGEVLNAGYTGVVSDYNSWFSLAPGDAMAAGSIFYATVADWVVGTGFDTHSVLANPNLTSSFLPGTTSPVIGKGLNLTSLGIAGLNVSAPQKFGVGGSCGTGCTPRPSTGAWDMGAYQHSSGTNTPVAPPSGLAAIVH